MHISLDVYSESPTLLWLNSSIISLGVEKGPTPFHAGMNNDLSRGKGVLFVVYEVEPIAVSIYHVLYT